MHPTGLPVIALVGRPNVGKSTIFNVLTRARDALVHDQPGVTRDRQYGVCRDEGGSFIVVDTGGLGGESDDLSMLAEAQVEHALNESALVVFVADARAGATAVDQALIERLRRRGDSLLIAVNKTDGLDTDTALADFERFGLDIVPLAAAHRRGIDDLIEAIRDRLPESLPATEEVLDDGVVRLAVIGRPNVGKSTLVNRLLGEDRVIASEVPGTTRDAIEVDFERDGKRYRLIDTAGLRRRSKVQAAVETFSALKALAAIEKSQVVLVMLDASEGITDQDLTVLSYAIDAGRGLIIVVNKWDAPDHEAKVWVRSELDRRLVFATYAPVVTISALHGSGLRELMKAIGQVHSSLVRKLSTPDVTRAVNDAVEAVAPPSVGGRSIKIRYAHSGADLPPTIVLHGNRLSKLPASYVRYLENYLRRHFRLVGVPLRLVMREGDNPFAGRKNVLTQRQRDKRKRLMSHVRRR